MNADDAGGGETPGRRVLVLDVAAESRGLIRAALSAAGFEVFEFADATGALASLEEVQPALIVAADSARTVDGEPFIAVARRTCGASIPWIALAAGQDRQAVLASLAAGAHDVATGPLDADLLAAKALALLRVAGRGSPDHRGGPLSGKVGLRGTLGLVKFCEDHRVSGRLTVDTGEAARWVEFRDGGLVDAGARPALPGEDPLRALLAVKQGTYLIERDPQAAAMPPAAALDARPVSPAAATPAVHRGRLSSVEVAGQAFTVQTEGANRPNFTVTTIVSRAGRVVRKTEASWQHPLRRSEDHDLARTQVDRQHDGLVLKVKRMAAEVGRRHARKAVLEGPLLAWAMYFIVEQVWAHLGTATTHSLLRRTHERLVARHPPLGFFRVVAAARIELDLAGGPLPPRGLVEAVAEWSAAFLEEAGRVLDEAGGVDVAQATVMMEPALRAAGFYRALEAARARA